MPVMVQLDLLVTIEPTNPATTGHDNPATPNPVMGGRETAHT